MGLYSNVDTSKDSKDFKFYTLYLSFFMIFIFVLEQFFGVDNFVLCKECFFSKPYLIVLSFLSHASFSHLLFNIFSFLLFGLLLEKRIGSKNFLFLFFLSGISINIFLPLSPYDAVIGVSGVVFFIIGMLSVLRLFFIFYFNFIPVPLFFLSVIYAFNDFFNVFFPSNNTASLFHLLGLFFGFILGFYFRFLGFGDDVFKNKNNNKNNDYLYSDENLDFVVDSIVEEVDNKILEENNKDKSIKGIKK